MDRDLSEEIVEAIADAEDVRFEDLDFVLYDYIDMEAIEHLVDHGGTWRLSFEVGGHEVTVTDDGSVSVDAVRGERRT